MPDPHEHADSAGEMPAESAQQDIPAGPGPVQVTGQAARGWHTWRRWHRSRPFWGGLLLVLSGAELLTLPLPLAALGTIIHIGLGGVLGILIGAILIVCGLLLWFHPAQRVFYAIVGILLALVSLIASNLGGFLLGTLLGVVGGSLAFAWTPGPAPAGLGGADPPPPAPVDQAGLAGSADPPPPAPEDQAGGSRTGEGGEGKPGQSQGEPGESQIGEQGTTVEARDGRSGDGEARDSGSKVVAVAVAPLVLLGLLGTSPITMAAGSVAAPSGQCLLGTLCPAASSSPTASPTASPVASPSPTVTPSPTASPSPSPSQTLTPVAGASSSPAPSPSSTPSPSPGRTGGTPTSGPRARSSRRSARPLAATTTLIASTATSSITAGSAALSGLVYDGVVNVPTAAGDVRMLKFSMTSMTLSGGTVLTVTDNGHTLLTRDSSLAFSGNVVLYTTRMSGDLLGVPQTFTPQNPPPAILPPDVIFTNVVTDQPFTQADSLDAGSLLITAS